MQDNDFLFKQNGDRPILKQPEKCGKDCVQYANCRFPKNCPVKIRERMKAREQESGFTRY